MNKMRYLKSFICYFATTLLIFAASSCKKDLEVLTPDFNVVAEKTTVTAGEPVLFNITGGADIITFYSGEPGSEYQYRNRVSVEGTPQLQFESIRKYGDPPAGPDTTLKVLISTDYTNELTEEGVKSATWINISDRADLSIGPATVQEYTPSGVIDLTEFYTPDVPIYLAFKFHGFESPVHSQRGWTIMNLFIDNKIEDGSLVSIADLGSLEWGALNLEGARTWSFNSSRLTIWGGSKNTPDNIDWLISMPIILDRVERDRGINIKNSPISKISEYEYTFDTPGTYAVTFEAINANRWDKNTTVKEIIITVQ